MFAVLQGVEVELRRQQLQADGGGGRGQRALCRIYARAQVSFRNSRARDEPDIRMPGLFLYPVSGRILNSIYRC